VIPLQEISSSPISQLIDIQRWARRDLNPGPRDYESPALTAELQARFFHSRTEAGVPSAKRVHKSYANTEVAGKVISWRLQQRWSGW
jgi:hypothetical protein